MTSETVSNAGKSVKAKAQTLNAARKYEPYPKYKDSGVEWLGKIPREWGTKRLKYTASLCKGKFQAKPDDAVYIGLEHVEPWTGKLIYGSQLESVESAVTPFTSGNILFGKLRPYLAKAACPSFDGVCTSEILVFRAQKDYSPDYLKFCLLSRSYIEWLNSNTYGTKMPRIDPSELENSLMPTPTLSQQKMIVEFLNTETAKIDALVAQKERLIELLKERRTALITRAVTKGLSPDAPMKDSGVEWLGEIPKHWEIKRLKCLATVNDQTLSESTAVDTPITYVDIGGVDATNGITSKEEYTFGNAPSRARRIVRCDDIIVSTVRTYLRAIAPISESESHIIVSTGFAVIRPVALDASFAAYALRAPYFVERVVANSIGVSYPAINASDMITFPIAFPNLSEQQSISLFLNRETEKINALIEKTHEAINKLKEFRIALISAAVTGKTDVQDSAVQ